MNTKTTLLSFLILFFLSFTAQAQIEFECGDNEIPVLIQMDVPVGSDDIEWALHSGDTLIADGHTGETEALELCLTNACHTISLFDQSDAGWSGGVVSIIMNNQTVASHEFSGDEDSVTIPFGYNGGCGEGCTNPEALNYDPEALVDDGSCILPEDCDGNWVELEIESEGNGGDIGWSITQDGIEIYTGSGYESYSDTYEWLCLADGCYTFYLYGQGSGWNGGEFNLELDNVDILEGTLPNGQSGEINFSINTDGCGETVQLPGCTDPNAENYSPLATDDDGSCEYEECDDITVFINFQTTVGDDDIEWELENNTFNLDLDDGISGGTQSISACVPDSGCYALSFEDNSFEGWNGSFTLTVDDVIIVEGEFGDEEEMTVHFSFNADPCGEGCTDPEAVNYDDDASIDDGSCLYSEDCTGNWAELEIETENAGGQISWNIVQDGVEIYGEGSYESYSEYSHWLCLEDGCYTFELFDSGSNGWNGGEFSLELDGEDVIEGYLPNGQYGSIEFSINSEDCGDEVYLPGCTDPAAVNYSEIATENDGSCEYPDCQLNEVIIQMDVTVGDDDIEYGVFSGDTLIADGYTGDTQSFEVCLGDGCHTLELYDLTDNWSGVASVIYNNEVIAFIQLGEEESYTIYFGINQEGCDEGEIPGCTDPEALNYDEEATVDDGSCIYAPECEIDFELLADEDFLNTIWIIPDEDIEDAISVLWDFGDGTTSDDIFPEHEYDGDGPYTLCLTVIFDVEGEEDCEATFCMEISADMIPDLIPGVNGSVGFNINVIPDETSIGVVENEFISDFSLYPNPVSDELNVSFSQQTAGEATISVLDLNGRTVNEIKLEATPGTNNTSIDLEELSSGVYIINLKSKGYTVHKKVIRE